MKRLLLIFLLIASFGFSQSISFNNYEEFLKLKTGGSTLPTDSAGYLYNNGTGTLSWAAISLSGYLRANGLDPLTADWPMGVFNLTQAGWHGQTIAVDYGGTGLTSYTIGDILHATGATTISKLAAVATGQVLTSAGTGTIAAWSASPTLTGTLTANNLTASTTLGNEIITFDGSAGSGTNFTWDAGFTWGSGKFTHNTGGGVVALTTVWVPTAGVTYKVIITSTDAGTGDVTPSMGGVVQPNITTSTTTTFYVKGSATALTLTPTNTSWTGTITGVSIMAVTNSALTGNSLTLNGGQLLLPISIVTYPTIASTVNPDFGLNLTNAQGQFIVDGTSVGNWNSTGMQLTNNLYSFSIGGGSSQVAYASDGGYAKIYSNYNILRLGTAASPTLDQTFQITASTGTDKAGGMLIIQSGQSTGTGMDGGVAIQTSTTSTTGSTANTEYTRYRAVGAIKTLTDASATAVCSFAVVANTTVGGMLVYTIKVQDDDASDFQVESGTVIFCGLQDESNWHTNISEVSTQALESGSLATTWAIDTATANTLKITCLADSDLTTPVITIRYQIFLNSPIVETVL